VTTEAPGALRIEPVGESDIPVLLKLIEGLADYEALSADVTATVEDLRRSLFGDDRAAEALIAWLGDEPIGFAVFFTSYSTFLGRPGIYLEDLYVEPERRHLGYGKRLLTHVARLAVARGCGRLEWSVLDWNAPAIGFYESLGAKPLTEWTMYRLAGDSLARLAAQSQE
jgi:GNAT superfamily N-acetyltransferase